MISFSKTHKIGSKMKALKGLDLDKVDRKNKKNEIIRKQKSIQKANEKWLNNDTENSKKRKGTFREYFTT